MSRDKHRFALYMEGIRVPSATATVVASVDQPATATITLVPTDAAFHAPERTLVHILWHDGTLWRRLFEGETVSKHIEYSGGHRRAVYRCQDMTLYWQQSWRGFFSIQADINSINVGDQQRRLSHFGISPSGATAKLSNTVTVGDLLSTKGFVQTTIDTGVERLMDHMARRTNGPYFAYADNRLKLRRRVISSDSPMARAVLSAQQGVASGEANEYSDIALVNTSLATLWTFMEALANRINYQIVPNPTAPYSRTRKAGGAVGSLDLSSADQVRRGLGFMPQVSFRPETYLSQPPRCNLMLPPLISSFTYDDYQQRAPTRTMLYVAGDINTYYAPEGLSLDSISGATAKDSDALTAEEKRRGFIPRIEHVDSADFGAAAVDAASTGTSTVVRSRAQMVNYKHWRSIYDTRTAQGSGSFNPYLSCGLTGSVIDPTFGYVLGDIVSINHHIDLEQGKATTSFAMARCRHGTRDPESPYRSEADRAREEDVPDGLIFQGPDDTGRTWLDRLYTDRNISRTLLEPLLGYGSSGGGLLESKEGRLESIPQAMSRVSTRFESSSGDERTSYVRSLQEREIATLYESMLFIGAEPVLSGDERDAYRKRKVAVDEDWEVLRGQEAASFQNPGGATQEEGNDAGDAQGPFIRSRQQWARAYLAQASRHAGRLDETGR